MEGEEARAAFRFIAEDDMVGYTEGANRLVRAVRASGARLECRALFFGGAGRPCALRRHSRDPFPNERRCWTTSTA
jgi:hypothetical protein